MCVPPVVQLHTRNPGLEGFASGGALGRSRGSEGCLPLHTFCAF